MYSVVNLSIFKIIWIISIMWAGQQIKQPGPRTSWFSEQWPYLGTRKLQPKRLKARDFIEQGRGAAGIDVSCKYSKITRNCSHSCNNINNNQVCIVLLFYILN